MFGAVIESKNSNLSMVIRRFLFIILIMMSLMSYSVLTRAADNFVNKFLCKGKLISPKHRIISDAKINISASGNGYRLNAAWLDEVYSGLGVARQSKSGRLVVSFALTGDKGFKTVVGILRETKGPQGYPIADVLSVLFSEMNKEQGYEITNGQLICEKPMAD